MAAEYVEKEKNNAIFHRRKECDKKKISFISRMSFNKGGLYDKNGRKTRNHTSLLIWGHNPEK